MPAMSASRPEFPDPPRNTGCGGLFFLVMLAIGAAWGAALGGFAVVLEDANEVIAALEDFRPKVGSKIYSADGELLGEFSIEERHLVRLTDIPLHVQKAFLATEDHLFYQHRGVRLDAYVNILVYLLRTGRTRGGSGITQQTVRNVETLGVGLDVSVMRKIREAIVALQVERYFTKDEILELYLNQIFLGISAHGVEAAARQYFGKPAQELTLGEAAVLAGLTRSPNRNNPITSLENATARMAEVLRQMHEAGFITAEERQAALGEDIGGAVITPERRAQLRAEGRGIWAPNRFQAPYFSEEIRRFALRQFGVEEVFEEGLEIRTTLDMRIQRAAERVLLTALDEFDRKRLESLQKAGREEEFVPVSGGLVCLDNRPGQEGFVRAMVGGRDFDKEKYNTATQAKRQPGSSIKPFVWAAAIGSGMTPSSVVVDAPFQRRDGAGRIWEPKNFDGKFNGPVTLRYSLEKSVNIVSVKLVERLGVNVVRSYLQSAGIRTPIDDAAGLTIGLGTPEVTLLDQAVAYSVFAQNGMRYDPVMVQDIQNRDGLVRYDYRDYRTSEQAMDPRVAFVVGHMMRGICVADAEVPDPTGRRTAPLERPRAGKTGTTNQSRNTWFCGYTPEFTAIVWIGYRDNRPLGRGLDYTGGRLACPIWTDFMVEIHKGLPVQEFPVPEGVEFHNIHRVRGTAGGRYREAYIAGNPPPGEWRGEVERAIEHTETGDVPEMNDLLFGQI